jgi:exopolysaccharide biosynthesis polyprenyl glycosylphosphotransferase
VRVRLGLQRRAQVNFRRHLSKAVRRLAVLVVADWASFYVMRALLRAVRDQAVLGETIAAQARSLLPSGILNGWQFAVALLVGLLVLGNYGPGDRRRDPRRLFLACALATALPLWMTVWTRGLEMVAVQFVLTSVLAWVGLVAERLTLDWVIARVAPRDRTAAPTLFVGPAEECIDAMRSPAFSSPMEHRLMGFVDAHIPPAPEALGHLVDFARVLNDTPAETVVVCGYLTDVRFHDVVDAALAAGCQVLSVPRAIEIAGVQPTLIWKHEQPLVELSAPSLKGWQLFVKRVVDLVGATVGLTLASPVMAICAILIKLDSPGPVFFRQERIGAAGRRFRVWKLRTMQHGASEETHRRFLSDMLTGDEQMAAQVNAKGERVFKLVNDNRVTRLGRWLRRTSLDEVPQLFNVLGGAMSLVGPRPPLDYEFQAYDQWQFDRLQVKPGITGLWQVSGRNRLTYREMCELDVQYVRNWSLWMDLVIMLKTIPVVLFNSGRAA